jgi:uncharacterized membrane protein
MASSFSLIFIGSLLLISVFCGLTWHVRRLFEENQVFWVASLGSNE